MFKRLAAASVLLVLAFASAAKACPKTAPQQSVVAAELKRLGGR
jgi:hypothetical protein